MKITIGTTVLGSGSPSQPGRIVGSVGKGNVDVSPCIEATVPDLFDRKNRAVQDIVEVDYSYADFASAQTAIATRRRAAFAATGSLVYGTAPADVTIGPALVEQVELLEFIGAGFTLRYTIIATETYS